MDNCPICNRHVLDHAKQISCSLCNDQYHMKCISLFPCELSRMQETSHWYCFNCLSGLFPFNLTEDNEMFISEIITIEIGPKVINSFHEMLFNRFKVNQGEHYFPFYESDPDVNYHNTIGSHLGFNCNYNCEDHFAAALKSKFVDNTARNIQSLCQLNIRSKRAEICLKNMEYNFSTISLSETWLRDYNCNFYNIDCYTLLKFIDLKKLEVGLIYLLGKMCFIEFEMTCVE